MDNLLELINVVNKHKVKQIEVLGNSAARKTMVQAFYDMLCTGALQNDIDAAAFFYDSLPDDRRYKDLKRRLIERLYNTVLFVDTNKDYFDDVAKAYYNCWKDYASAKVLAGRSAIASAYPLLEKTLKQALQFGFSELIINISRLLKFHYGTNDFDLKRFHYFNEIYHQYRKRYDADVLAEEYYSLALLSFYGVNQKNLEESYQQSQVFIKELKPLTEKYDSYKLNICYYLIQLTAANSKAKFENAIHICENALDFFNNNLKYPTRSIGIFSRQLFLLYWQKREYSKGVSLLEKAKNHTIEGSIGWFANYDFFFLLCMHTKRYQKAYETLRNTIQHPRFGTLPDYDQERWKIYEAYTAYLCEIKEIEISLEKKFRVAKFLNEVPIFSSDKRSRNIPILIIQVLFLLLHQKYDRCIDRMESINLYCKRYLRRDKTFRSDCFIKMLLKIIEADFHKAGAIRKASNLKTKLESVPLEVAKQIYETEIIPYEHLWELVLDSLENKFWQTQ